MNDAVVSHHMNPFRSGVARFNELLAAHLGVPFAALDAASAFRRPLLSFKVSELDADDEAAVTRGLDTWPQYDVFVHELAGTSLERRLVEGASRVLCGNLELSERLAPLPSELRTLWTPGLIVAQDRIAPTEVRVFTFGMAHKIRTDMFERLRDLLEDCGRSYSVHVSAANHETASLRDAELVFADMHRIFPERMYFLGNLSDLAIIRELEQATFFAAFFEGGVRANNTSVASAMERGAVVVTNLDGSSPRHLRHLETVIDIEQTRELPFEPLLLRQIGVNAMRSARDLSWERLVEQVRA